ERFNAVDERFKEIDGRFDAVDERFKEIDERFDAVDERFKEMDKRLDRLETDVNDLKKGQEQLPKTIIENIGQFTENIIEYADDKAAALNDRVFNVETAIQRLYKLSS
ncbi:hypothetical protein MOD79_00900, partial [Bacillus haynesii]|uniref:hypothetical protein n=1 Tax=Bacillus haynesii TaxID=1925021 RepID=UPI00227E01BC